MLELFGGNASPAVPVLIRATRVDSVLLRRAAANTLGLVGTGADLAIPALVDLVLFDESDEVRSLAGRALGRVGETAEGPLVQLLTDVDADVRLQAAMAFGEMQSVAPETEIVLREAAAGDEPRVAVAALLAVWRTTAAADEAGGGRAALCPPGGTAPIAFDSCSPVERRIRRESGPYSAAVNRSCDIGRPCVHFAARDDRSSRSQAWNGILTSFGTAGYARHRRWSTRTGGRGAD
jgi:hypothetical protein